MSAVALALALVLFALGVALGLYNWRWSVVGLVLYLPISGIAIDAAYGHRFERALAVLAKDYLFVLPAYLGFAVAAVRQRRSPLFPGAPVVAVALLTVVVLVQALNPQLPNRLVGLIGIKVWLFYVPLLVLGYYLAPTLNDLRRLFGLVTVAALLPAAIGIVEAVLLYSGHESAVYRLYGDAAAAVTQNYAAIPVAGTAAIKRVPSTFSSFYQYYLFLSVSLVCAFAWWRGTAWPGRRSALGAAAVVVLVAASLLSGVRLAFAMTPLLLALALVAEGRRALRLGIVLVPVAGLLVAAAAVIGAGPHALTANLWHVTRVEFSDVIVHSSREAVSTTVFGVGTGVDSIAARYAFSDDDAWLAAIVPLLGDWHESWYVKVWLELGVVGVLVVAALFGSLLWRGALAVRAAAAGWSRSAAAGLFALLVWTMLYAVKSQYLDLDPLNAYFWLFAGVLLGIPRLRGAETAAAPDAAVAEPRSAARRITAAAG